MGSQEVSPQPDPEPVEPSSADAFSQTSAQHPVAKNSRSRRAPRKSLPKSSKAEKKTGPEVWVGAVENAIEAFSLFYDGGVAVVGHLVTRVIPETPSKGLPFVAVLAVLTFIIGNKEAKNEQLCFGCFLVLGVIAVCLVIIAVKNPGTDVRLREMQDERVRAIKVKPLQY